MFVPMAASAFARPSSSMLNVTPSPPQRNRFTKNAGSHFRYSRNACVIGFMDPDGMPTFEIVHVVSNPARNATGSQVNACSYLVMPIGQFTVGEPKVWTI